MTYVAGWYNVEPGEMITWRSEGGTKTAYEVPPGLYGVDQLKDIIMGRSPAVVTFSQINGILTVILPHDVEVKFTDGLLRLMGLDDGLGGVWLESGVYIGDRSVDFTTTKALCVHLEQLNCSSNIVDGRPSTLLSVVGLRPHSFGDVCTARVEHPEFKRLRDGTVDELKVVVRDDTGRLIDNHNLSIAVVLEIC